MVETISPQEVRNRLLAGGELAFLDVREAGQFGLGHPLLAVPLPYSRLELEVARLVPRRNAPIVLLDAGDGVAERAARRLEALGYGDVATVEGGAPGWATAGYALFEGVNVPSKALGEHIEHAFETPAISPEDLRERVTRGEKIVLVDARPPAEYRRMTVPGALDCPGAELIRRVPGLVEDETTPVVVHCAGRTRSIVGAQTLIEAGVARPAMPALPEGAQWIAPEELSRRLAQDPPDFDLVDVGESAGFRAGHVSGARWLPRPRFAGALRARPSERGLVLVSEDGALAVLAAHDAQETIEAPVAVLRGGRNAWRAAGFPLESSPDDPPDSERIDFLFWVHDRHAGNKDSMREYLAWEQALPARVAADGTLRFAPPAGAAQSSLRHRKHK